MGVARRSVYERMVRGDAPNAWWRFKSGAELSEEIVGAALALTKTGTITEVTSLLTDAVSASEKARDFDGSTGKYTAPDHANLDVGDIFTLEAWVKPDAIGNILYIVVKGTNAFAMFLGNSGELVLRKVGVANIVSSTVNLAAGQVYHVVATKNGATVKLYVNGVDRTGTVTNQTCANNTDSLTIGATGSVNWFDGTIGEVAIYPTALSATRILEHYNAGASPFEQIAAMPSLFPKQRLDVGLESGPKDEFPKWTSLSSRLRSWSLSHGRSHEFSQVDTAALDAELDNRDRALESGYAASPYYPNVKQTKQLMLTLFWSGVQYDRFRGNISDWGPDWPAGGVDSVARIKAHDAQKLANLQDLTGALSQQATGARINAALDAMSVPSGMRDIDAGVPDVVAVANAEGTNLLSHLQDTAKADPGLVFVDGSGWWVFQDRNHRQTSESVSRATFGDAPGELPYRTLRPRDDDADIWNDIRITVAGTGNLRTASDATSITDHGKRSKSESLNLVTDAQGDAVASYWLNLYKNGKRRIPEIECAGGASPALLWPVLLGAEISWRLITLRRPAGGGAAILIEQHLEGIRISASHSSIDTAMHLSPADTQQYWELGTAGKSELGQTTYLYI